MTTTVTPEAADVVPEDTRAWGANRIAALLSDMHGCAVHPGDIAALHEAGLIAQTDEYKGHLLYSVADAEALDPDIWIDTMTSWDVAQSLGWRLAEWQQVVADRAMEPGPAGRWPVELVEQVRADEPLQARVAAERTISGDQAAALLEIRPTDWKCVVAAGWITPHEISTMTVGRSGRRTVDVPMYRTQDVRDLLDLPGVDWEAVRAVRPGERSPLREYTTVPPTRAEVMRAFAAGITEDHGVDAFAGYNPWAGCWEIDWIQRSDGTPSVETIRADLAANPVASRYAAGVRLMTEAGKVIGWARRMLEPDAAVILDVESTSLDGRVVEIAVVCAASGKVLLNTLVQPGEPIEVGARAVHGISDADVRDAPTLDRIWTKLLRVTKGRTVLAYHSAFDERIVCGHARALELRLGHLGKAETWECLMTQRQVWADTWHPAALGGAHRAKGDCEAARKLLIRIGQGPAGHRDR